MVLLCNSSGCLVDAAVLLNMHLASDVELASWIRYHLFVLEHELVAVEKLIVRRCAPERVLRFQTVTGPGHR